VAATNPTKVMKGRATGPAGQGSALGLTGGVDVGDERSEKGEALQGRLKRGTLAAGAPEQKNTPQGRARMQGRSRLAQ
jgi:hypothetical protein